MIPVIFLGTASHLPYNRNGFKFFTNSGGLGKVDIKDILERAADLYKNFTDEGLREAERRAAQSIKRVDYMSVYTSDLVAAVRKASGNIGVPFNMHYMTIRWHHFIVEVQYYQFHNNRELVPYLILTWCLSLKIFFVSSPLSTTAEATQCGLLLQNRKNEAIVIICSNPLSSDLVISQ